MFANIGKKDCVQAKTLQSRYVLLEFFIKYLRKNQVFAEMSRAYLNINTNIKQRKMEVRKNKVCDVSAFFVFFGEFEI